MKIKGINIFELHVEKMVLGGTLVVAGLLVARQFLTNPNAVTFGGDEYSPAAVDPAIKKRVETLEMQLRSDRKLEYSTGESLAGYFKGEQQRSFGTGSTLAHSIVRSTPMELSDLNVLGGAVGLYTAFAPPAPSNLRVLARPYTLSAEILSEYPDLKPFLPQEAPFDIPAVQIFGEVDGAALHEILLRPEEGHNAIPSAWWDNDMTILDVVVERELRLDDGSWGELQVVQTIPGQKSIRDEIATITPLEQNEMLDLVFEEYQKELYQPAFYTLQNGEKWTTDLVRALEPLSPEAEEAVAKMRHRWREVGKLRSRLEAMLNKDNERGVRRPAAGGGKGGGGGGGEVGGSTRDPGQDRKKRQEELDKRRLERLEKELAASENYYDELKEEVRALVSTYDLYPDEEEARKERAAQKANEDRQNAGGPMPGGGGEGYDGGMSLGGPPVGKGGYGGEYNSSQRGGRGKASGRNSRLNVDEKRLLENDSVEVWVHDIAIEAGAMYRYRMRIDYHNPFFGKDNRLSDVQKEMSTLAYTSSATTDWSDPMQVVATKQFYVTKGTVAGAIEDRRAAIEVYVYTGGSERLLALSIRPGEPIGEIRQEIARLGSSELEKDEITDSPDSEDDKKTAANEKIFIDYTTGAVLLDVIEINQNIQVLVALEDGTIVVIDPEEQKASEARRWLKELVAKDAK